MTPSRASLKVTVYEKGRGVKINVVKDENGKVIATFPKAIAGASQGLYPVLKPRHKVHEVDAPENYLAHLKTFYKENSK